MDRLQDLIEKLEKVYNEEQAKKNENNSNESVQDKNDVKNNEVI